MASIFDTLLVSAYFEAQPGKCLRWDFLSLYSLPPSNTLHRATSLSFTLLQFIICRPPFTLRFI